MDGRELEDLIVRYIKQCGARGVATGSIQLKLSAIRKFFVENRQENQLNWSWLKSRIPKGNGKVKDRDYTKEELQKMWEQSDVRKKAVLALFMTGVRKGAISDLRVGSLAKIMEYHDRRREKQVHKFEGYHMYKLTVYEGSSEQYITFLTPAGAKAIDRYLEP
jgi:3-oxoacyl-ACP reductase-like protein